MNLRIVNSNFKTENKTIIRNDLRNHKSIPRSKISRQLVPPGKTTAKNKSLQKLIQAP